MKKVHMSGYRWISGAAVVLLLMLVSASGPALAQAPQVKAPVALLKVKVVNQAEKPLKGAAVKAVSGRKSVQGSSDAHGMAALKVLPGETGFTVTLKGYQAFPEG